MLKRLRNSGIAPIALVIGILAAASAVLYAQGNVKNYFTPCSGVNCDNIFVQGGTQNITSGGVLDVKTGAVIKDNGTDVSTDFRAILGAGLNATELGYLDAVVAGTAAASKALVADANSAVDILRTASLRIGTSGSETTVSRTGAEINLLLQGVAAGYKIARAETALDGSNPTTVATGLATIVTCFANIKGTAAPGLGTSVITFDWSAANVSLYGWKPTGAGDTTLIASTGTETIGWVCIGT